MDPASASSAPSPLTFAHYGGNHLKHFARRPSSSAQLRDTSYAQLASPAVALLKTVRRVPHRRSSRRWRCRLRAISRTASIAHDAACFFPPSTHLASDLAAAFSCKSLVDARGLRGATPSMASSTIRGRVAAAGTAPPQAPPPDPKVACRAGQAQADMARWTRAPADLRARRPSRIATAREENQRALQPEPRKPDESALAGRRSAGLSGAGCRLAATEATAMSRRRYRYDPTSRPSSKSPTTVATRRAARRRDRAAVSATSALHRRTPLNSRRNIAIISARIALYTTWRGPAHVRSTPRRGRHASSFFTMRSAAETL